VEYVRSRELSRGGPISPHPPQWASGAGDLSALKRTPRRVQSPGAPGPRILRPRQFCHLSIRDGAALPLRSITAWGVPAPGKLSEEFKSLHPAGNGTEESEGGRIRQASTLLSGNAENLRMRV
jgi:hypothetical protein